MAKKRNMDISGEFEIAKLKKDLERLDNESKHISVGDKIDLFRGDYPNEYSPLYSYCDPNFPLPVEKKLEKIKNLFPLQHFNEKYPDAVTSDEDKADVAAVDALIDEMNAAYANIVNDASLNTEQKMTELSSKVWGKIEKGRKVVEGTVDKITKIIRRT